MALVILTTSSTSPWAVPGDFLVATSHKVTLFGPGGNGAVGTSGTSGTSGGGGGGGACTVLTYSSGTITPGTTTIPFLVSAGGSPNATQWQSSTAGTGSFYEALPGGNGAATGTAGAASGATTTVGTPTITYTAVNHTGGAGGAGGGVNTLGAGGGGGAGGPAANGGTGGTPTSTGGGGGGGGGAANAGGSPGTATGGTGGNGSTGAGGSGSGVSGTPGGPGTGSSGGGGGPGASVISVGGVGGNGTDLSPTAGCGGGGGGSGSKITTGAATTVTGGNGGNYGGGGGGVGCQRTAGGTLTAGNGAPGVIAIAYTSTAWGWDQHQERMVMPFGMGSPQARRSSALRQRLGFPIFPPSVPYWQHVQDPQPPHPRREKAGALMRGHDGIEGKFVPPPPPVTFVDVQPTGAARAKRALSALRGRSEFAYPITPYPLTGFEQVASQDRAPPIRRGGAIMRGHDGIEGKFVPPVVVAIGPSGFDPVVQPPARKPNYAGLAQRVQFGSFAPWVNVGFEQVASADRHPHPERGAVLRGPSDIEPQLPTPPTPLSSYAYDFRLDLRITRSRGAGIEGISEFAPSYSLPWGFEVPPPMLRQPRRTMGALKGRSEFAFSLAAPITPFGWESPWLPMRIARSRGGAIMPKADVEVPFVFVLPTIAAWGYEQQPVDLLHRFRKSPDTGDQGIQFPFVRFTALDWPQPAHQPRWWPQRAGALMRGPDGTDAPGPRLVALDWPAMPVQPPHPRPERWAALAPGSEVPTSLAFVVPPWQYEPNPFQPPHPRRERSGAVAEPLSFAPTGLVFVVPPWQFETNPFQPPHPLRERAGAIQEPTSFAPTGLVFAAPPPWQFEANQFQPPHRRSERSGAIAEPQSFAPTGLIFAPPPPWQYEPNPFQPPHPRRERSGAIEEPLSFAPTKIVFAIPPWFEPNPFQPPRPRPHYGGLAQRVEFGSFAYWLNTGFEPTLPILLRPRIERRGAFLFGETGTEAKFVPPAVASWFEVSPALLPHPRRERAGVLFGGDPGNQTQARPWYNAGWEPILPSPLIRPPATGKRAGAVLRGDEGIQDRFHRFFPLLQEHTPSLFLRRPQPRVPVFLIQSVESYAPFVAGARVAKATSILTGWGAETEIGVMEMQIIISAMSGNSDLERP